MCMRVCAVCTTEGWLIRTDLKSVRRKKVQICKVDVCTCIIGAEKSAARSSRTNGQRSELIAFINTQTLTTHICMSKGHWHI